MSFQIHLNSRNADTYNNNSISDCNYYLPQIETRADHQINVSIQSANIPYSFYNINTSNNYLKYSFNNDQVLRTLTIEPGNYTCYSLLDYLSANLYNIVVAYNAITNKYTFTGTSDFKFYYQSFIFSPCFTILGFSMYDQLSVNKVLTSNICSNLSTVRCICINSNLSSDNFAKSNANDKRILVSIPVNVSPFSIIIYQNLTNFKTNLFSNTLSFINLKLVDQDGMIIDLNGCHWSCVLQIDIDNYVD